MQAILRGTYTLGAAILAFTCAACSAQEPPGASQDENGAATPMAGAGSSTPRSAPPGKAGAATTAAAARPASDEAAIFSAAGFTQGANGWESGNCPAPHEGSYSPGAIEQVGDFNADGRTDAIVTESGGLCYGLTGAAFWLVSQQEDGSWRMLHTEIGLLEFLAETGADNWPDISLGGPGFCFPVLRWTGDAYERVGFAYEGQPCTPPDF